MSCCGRHRETFRGTSQPSQGAQRAIDRPRTPLPQSPVRFEYVGATGLTVLGPVTGKRYRFDRSGSRVLIEPRDVASIAAVPHLRRV